MLVPVQSIVITARFAAIATAVTTIKATTGTVAGSIHFKSSRKPSPARMIPHRRLMLLETVAASLRRCSSRSAAEDSAVHERNLASMDGRDALEWVGSFVKGTPTLRVLYPLSGSTPRSRMEAMVKTE